MSEPLELLYEAEGVPAFPLPAGLAARYGGTLGFEQPRLVANFVSTIDGVVSIPSVPGSVQLIGGRSDDDRFVMALLRACADAVVMGATTVRGSAEGRWTAESLYPESASAFAELRRDLGRTRSPELVIVTRSGRIDPAHPALEAGAVIVTTDDGAARLEGRVPGASTVISLGPQIDLTAALGAIRGRGHAVIVSEGGPTLLGSLVRAGLVDELFLTVSPTLAGRNAGERLSLVEGVELLPDTRVGARLLGLRRAGAQVFLRYALD